MASTGTATGPQKADGTVHQPEAAAGVDRQHSGAQFRQEGASLSETSQAAGIKGSGSTAAEPGLLDDVDDGSGSGLGSGSEGSKTAFDAAEAAPDHDHSGNRGQVGADAHHGPLDGHRQSLGPGQQPVGGSSSLGSGRRAGGGHCPHRQHRHLLNTTYSCTEETAVHLHSQSSL